MSNCCKANAMARRGFTLIELLIVMGVLTILATLSLTTVKGLLKDQKITQAAQLVTQYFETARVRALTNGRPVAVFLDRVSVTGNGAGDLVPGNFMANRLSIGEVFPPYTGDVISATGSLWDVNMDLHSPAPSSRHSDGFADQIRFTPPSSVAAGFGPGGFVSVGDTIQFEGYIGSFTIEAIETTASSEIAVTFFNPPEDYNPIRYARLSAGQAVNATYESTHSRVPPQIPVIVKDSAGNRSALSSTTTTSSGFTTSLGSVSFRVYRRPTKSLVGAVTLPRGTCIDLSASGFGSSSAGVGDASSPFSLTAPPSTAAVNLASYSRVGVLFTAEGRVGGVVVENNIGGTKTFGGVEAGQILHLLVGRTEQVVPGDLSTAQLRKLAILQRSLPTDRDPVRSNLLDNANTWVTCNPFTGEVKASPVAPVTEATLTTVRNNVTATPTASIAAVVDEARALSISGVRQ